MMIGGQIRTGQANLGFICHLKCFKKKERYRDNRVINQMRKGQTARDRERKGESEK